MLFDIPLVVNRMGGSSDPLNGAGQPPLQRQVNAAWVYRTRSILKVTRILRLMRLVRLYQRYKVRPSMLDCLMGPPAGSCVRLLGAHPGFTPG